jgi:hypothetical protein
VLRLDGQLTPSLHALRCLDAIDHEVHQDLLELHAITHDLGKIWASSVRTNMLYRVASLSRRAIISRITSFTSTDSRFEGPFWNCNWTRLMMSRALRLSRPLTQFRMFLLRWVDRAEANASRFERSLPSLQSAA